MAILPIEQLTQRVGRAHVAYQGDVIATNEEDADAATTVTAWSSTFGIEADIDFTGETVEVGFGIDLETDNTATYSDRDAIDAAVN